MFPPTPAAAHSNPESLVLLLALLALQQPAPSDPTAPYWQQHVAYEIGATLDEPSGVLSGTERIRYHNNSPDTLTAFALHLHLNAFRPGSRWADTDSAEGRRRFNDLRDPDFAFNHVRDVRIMGVPAEPTYPYAPDSTVVRFALSGPLAPGDSMVVELAWDARPSTVPRRQGRQGRRFDFAQWYPKVVVYDRFGWEENPLVPSGEFYGEFGSYLVDLDVADDQVIGATGVPVCGDPGWARVNQNPERPVNYQRDYYGARTPTGEACGGAAPGRKRLRWYAEDVHHFALSLNPAYLYEEGRFGDAVVRVLYQRVNQAAWRGVAVERTEEALAWLDRIFGKFAWPQLTNVDRIEPGGGTEEPMLILNDSPDLGLIVHEAGHNYVQGILANNEWREAWLDEGFSNFQAGWMFEMLGRPSSVGRSEATILELDLDQYSEAVGLPAAAFQENSVYYRMTYTRGELFFHQLRYVVGDEVMLRILRTYYDRWKLKHVDEAAFQAVAEEVSGLDLSDLFAQWLHTTELYDYAVGRVRTRGGAPGQRGSGAGWVTRVEVVRKSPGRIPVEVFVIGERDTAVVRSEGVAEREWVEVATESRPRAILLDPRVMTHDWNMVNNRKDLGFRWTRLLTPLPDPDIYFHHYFSGRSRRDRGTFGWHPTVWYNDAGGVTLGVWSRDDYLGRFEQNVAWLTRSTGWGADDGVEHFDLYLRARNPTFLRSPNLSQSVEIFKVEGRYGATGRIEHSRRELSFGPTWSLDASIQWVHPDDFRYLDRGYYEDVGTVELQLGAGVAARSGAWQLGARSTVGGGLAYNRNGLAASGRADLDPFYYRGTLEGTARRALGRRWLLGLRAFAGVGAGNDEAPKQRQIYFQGADPLAQLGNPLLRSRGALLVGDDFHYQMPGGAGVRGADPRLSTAAIVALNLELERTLLARPQAGLFNRVALAAFSDLAQAIGGSAQPGLGDRIRFLGDAGFGVRVEHRIGDTRFVTRFDLPLYLSRPEVAPDASTGDDEFGFRWVFSFQ
jgi:hypothetical protein